ncbi:MAG TPA: hypothetical protein VLF63_00800, partial [Patescibacteria group bacterium]|nr:hypothetical protein [Patescibacteria group bacterium]
EYAQTLGELDALVASLPDQFPDDIEYSRSGFRLLLRNGGMESDTYLAVTKSLTYPYAENPDWTRIPAKLGLVAGLEVSGGYVTEYEMKEGLLTARSYIFENNEFSDEEFPTRTLSVEEIRKLVEDLSISQPFHPDKVENEPTHRTTKIGSLIRKALFH